MKKLYLKNMENENARVLSKLLEQKLLKKISNTGSSWMIF